MDFDKSPALASLITAQVQICKGLTKTAASSSTIHKIMKEKRQKLSY